MKYIIILGCAADQVPMYEKARKLGIKTIGIDYNPTAPGLTVCDLPIVSSAKHIEQVMESLHELEDQGVEFLGVTTLGMEISPIVSKVAKEFDLIAVTEATAHLTTNKCSRNYMLSANKIPIPKFEIVERPEEITMKFPFVIKPSDSSGSRGVRRVDIEEDMVEAFEDAMIYSSDSRVLVEELLKGPQISIEGFMLDGKMFVTGFADRNYLPNSPINPQFIENGGQVPSNLPLDIQQQAEDVFEASALALGIINGPSKGDLIVVDGKVIVIEITSRLSGGGFCSRVQRLQNGTDIVTATIQWATRLEVDKNLLLHQFEKFITHRYYLHDAGEVVSIKGINKVKSMPGVYEFVQVYPLEVGDVLEELNYINRVFYVITVSDSAEQSLEYANNAIKAIDIQVK